MFSARRLLVSAAQCDATDAYVHVLGDGKLDAANRQADPRSDRLLRASYSRIRRRSGAHMGLDLPIHVGTL
jgi:hypothetical protein